MALVVRPYHYVPKIISDASEVNSDLDTLYTLVNGNLNSANFANTISWEASNVSIVDTGNLYTSTHIEGALAETMPLILNAISQATVVTTSVTSTSYTLVENRVFITDCSSCQVVLTLPTSSTIGSFFKIIGKGSGGWKVAQNASQYIVKDIGASVAGSSGYLLSSDARACAELVCISTDTIFTVRNSQGGSIVAGGFQGSVKGYCIGGYTGAAASAKIDDLIFSNETSSELAASLSAAKYFGTGCSSDLKGYHLGGNTGAVTAAIEYVLFSDDSRSALAATLDAAKQYGAGISSSVKGYMMGGNTDGANTCTAVIEDLVYSGETSSAIAATIDSARQGTTGVNSDTKGYCMAGHTTGLGGAGDSAAIDDLLFSNDTSSAIAETVDVTSVGAAGVSSLIKGYKMGGVHTAATGYRNQIEALLFSNETISTIAATLDTAKGYSCGVTGPTKGYCIGGTTGSTTGVIESLVISDETSSAIAATLDVARQYVCGVQN